PSLCRTRSITVCRVLAPRPGTLSYRYTLIRGSFLSAHLDGEIGPSVEQSFPADDYFQLPRPRKAQLTGIEDVMRRWMKGLRSVLVLAQRLIQVLVLDEHVLHRALVAVGVVEEYANLVRACLAGIDVQGDVKVVGFHRLREPAWCRDGRRGGGTVVAGCAPGERRAGLGKQRRDAKDHECCS